MTVETPLAPELARALSAAQSLLSASAPPPAGEPQRAVDEEHPWLGLASFTEETRAFFFGREEEIAELSRRVQRKLLTILFGQSGLGKTSILRAGIVPKLRPMGYCPVYVRIDYAAEAPPPAEQIKQAIFRATEADVRWTQPGIAASGESLWEFLHHRGDVLKDSGGNTVVPLLIFDQFEEIFTLAQADEAGRKRAAGFVEELADLVENRPPKAVEAKIESDDAFSERFDFARADYRILIALREDYLAHLEGLRAAMPSITQNRMRLAPMTGQQALAAVRRPGGRLVTEEVAESIVRFIAGGSEIANAEVEPSLLSLICRELNNARIAQGRAEISVDLLAGSNETILAEFYERALADQPAAVRRFIEDEMLTDSGYRESLAEERVRKAFNAAGARADALARLVDRRLLRIEERLDLRRVELTHDVLCSVVAASRDMRHAREAREAAERQLAEQRAREAATRQSLARARKVAAFCIVLAIFAVAGAGFGYWNMQRAHVAEGVSRDTYRMAQSARGEAEKLVVYLLDDFYRELAPIGELGVVEGLAKRAVAYYRELPAALNTPETKQNHALALLRYGSVTRSQNKLDEADAAFGEAYALLEALRKAGDSSPATMLGLARARFGQAQALANRSDYPRSVRAGQEALEILQPLAGPGASKEALITFGEVNVGLGFVRLRTSGDAATPLTAARETFLKLGALDYTDLSVSHLYSVAGGWLGEALNSKGRAAEARAVFAESVRIADGILSRRPGYMPAMRTKSLASSFLGGMEATDLHFGAALARHQESRLVLETVSRLDPSNASVRNNLAVAHSDISFALFRLGRLDEALRSIQSTVSIAEGTRSSGFLASNLAFWNGIVAQSHAELGDAQKSAAAMAAARKYRAQLPASTLASLDGRITYEQVEQILARATFFDGRVPEGLAMARDSLARIEAFPAPEAAQQEQKRRAMVQQLDVISQGAELARDFPALEASARRALALRKDLPARNRLEALDESECRTLLAKALARQGRLKEADAALQPALAFHAGLKDPAIDDQVLRGLRAHALLVAYLAAPAERRARLDEAAAIIDGTTAEYRRWKPAAALRAEIAAERKKAR